MLSTRRSAFMLTAIFLAASCRSTPDPNFAFVGTVGYPSQLAQRHYAVARQAWLGGDKGEYQGGLICALKTAVEKLGLAVDLDPESPLYPSKRADLLMLTGRGEEILANALWTAIGTSERDSALSDLKSLRQRVSVGLIHTK
ncbi:MAG: hypothetical protein ACI841_000727 [Planctomycetota bacterium]|jgi:hypothetical protein